MSMEIQSGLSEIHVSVIIQVSAVKGVSVKRGSTVHVYPTRSTGPTYMYVHVSSGLTLPVHTYLCTYYIAGNFSEVFNLAIRQACQI